METYRVRVGPGVEVTGLTASGERRCIAPGEYHVHRLVPKGRQRRMVDTLRFVGADARGEDVHVRVPGGADVRDALPVEVIGPTAADDAATTT